MTERGVIYVATGQRYVDEARVSAASLKNHHPDLPVTLFTEHPVDNPLFDHVEIINSCGNGLRDRTLCLMQSPYEQTLFLDSDTYICDDISDLFDLLDRFDMAATHAPNRRNAEHDGVPASFPQFNLGVWIFRKTPQMDQLFAEWLRLYDEESQNWDARIKHLTQPTFRIAVYHSNIRFTNLTPEYNCRYYDSGYLEGKVKILHGHASAELLESAAKKINANKGQRVHVAGNLLTQKRQPIIGGLTTKSLGRFLPTLFERAANAIRSEGFSGFISKMTKRLGRQSSN